MTDSSSSAPAPVQRPSGRTGPALARAFLAVRAGLVTALLCGLFIPDSEIAAKSFKLNMIAKNVVYRMSSDRTE